MITLIGQFDSPFVRRVGIALRLYGMPFDHRPWSVFGDAEKIRPLNPLVRVPTLVLPDGDVLTDSHLILDWLDGQMHQPLFPRTEPDRHRALWVAGLACGLADKAVSLFYERRLHDVTSPVWTERCEGQIGGVLRALEADRAGRSHAWWFGDHIGHADIAVACALRFANEAHPGLTDWHGAPALAAHCAAAEAMEVFQQVSQPFVAPGT